MKEQTLRALLGALADGERHTALAASLGLTPGALEAHRAALVEAGCAIEPDGDGLRWRSPVPLLDEGSIATAVEGRVSVAVRTLVGSTNALLLDTSVAPSAPTVLLAEAQLAGRGRSGRRWLSPFGSNLYMSLAFDWTRPVADLGGLSLAIGTAAAEALQGSCDAEVRVKWPNDLLHDGAKLAGILIETTRVAPGVTRVVVGMGTNVNATAFPDGNPDQPWTSLALITGGTLDRNPLASGLVLALVDAFELFEREGLAPFEPRWHRHDAFAGREVRASGPGGAITGVARGIDPRGRLLVETASGTIPVDAGDVSLRLAGEES